MAEVAWPLIEKGFKADLPIIIPLGAGCKEHGLHLPMNTDLIIADYLADWLGENFEVLIAPTIQYNYFPAFIDYPGSANIDFDLSVRLFIDLCTCWHQQGAKAFYVLNTGISTNEVLANAADTLMAKGINFQFFDYSALDSQEEIKAITQQKSGSHADEIETSIMLYIKPEVVDMSKAESAESPFKPGPLTRDPLMVDRIYSTTGAYGDPTLASWEKGEIAVNVLKRMLKAVMLG
ncbi:MAG: creatininase family protein [Tatlockia sp.]|nr:creatininase family protein [Tatlockia sp.]